MPKLIVFNHVSLDGYFVSADGDMSWAHTRKDDDEWNAFVAENASGGGALVFGRVTYQMMEGFWPTPMAAQMMPEVAERMNNLPKIVFSKTLDEAMWNNTRLIKGDLVDETRKLKEEPGEGMTIMGSGTIVAQLARAGLIDEYHIVVNPIVLGAGRTLFDGLPEKLNLKLTKSRAFGNGCVYLSYEAPVGS
jgi:dihydrofolate reductase